MTTSTPTKAAKWFDDWRITLGITLGVLCFSATCVVLGISKDQAWLTIQAITGVCLCAGAYKAART